MKMKLVGVSRKAKVSREVGVLKEAAVFQTTAFPEATARCQFARARAPVESRTPWVKLNLRHPRQRPSVGAARSPRILCRHLAPDRSRRDADLAG